MPTTYALGDGAWASRGVVQPAGPSTAYLKVVNDRLDNVVRESVAQYSIFMEPPGLYRERNGWGNQHCARVKYDEHQEPDVPEDRYLARGYQPPFDELLWKDEAANDA